jgi:hypothetical protein
MTTTARRDETAAAEFNLKFQVLDACPSPDRLDDEIAALLRT